MQDPVGRIGGETRSRPSGHRSGPKPGATRRRRSHTVIRPDAAPQLVIPVSHRPRVVTDRPPPRAKAGGHIITPYVLDISRSV